VEDIATVLHKEPKEYRHILQHELHKGVSFPQARENALMMYLNDIKRYANVLRGSNNILAIEYIKALKKLKSSMNVIGVKREKVQYHQEEIVQQFASATAVRKLLLQEQYDVLKGVMPKVIYYFLMEQVKRGKWVSDISVFDKAILCNLRKMSVKDIAELPDVSEGLEYAIKEAAGMVHTIPELVNLVKSKRYTQTRIQRILVCALLGITKKNVQNMTKVEPYARVLGFTPVGKQMLADITKANPKLPLITSVKRFEEGNKNKNIQEMLDLDKLATDIYTLGQEGEAYANLDYTHKMIIIK
jgi:predicted nucleotidyltransferase